MGVLFFWPSSKAYISLIIHIFLMHTNDGRWRQFHLKKMIRTTSCFTIRIEISSPLHSRDNLSTVRLHKRKTDILYKLPSPRFEPTTFLIQVNTKPVFTPKTTVPWLFCQILFCQSLCVIPATPIDNKRKQSSLREKGL